MSSGIGISATRPEPIELNGLLMIPMGAPLVTMKAAPRKTARVPRVAITGSILPLVINRPLIRPANTPTSKPTAIPPGKLLLPFIASRR